MSPAVAQDRDDLPLGAEVWCPTCEADPGEPCRSPIGRGQRSTLHRLRRAAGVRAGLIGVDPARVSCPVCGADSYEPCRFPGGQRRIYHVLRWRQLEGGDGP